MTNGCKVQRFPRENQKQRSVVIAMETSNLIHHTLLNDSTDISH